MADKVKAIPPGMHTVTPYLTVVDAKKAIAFYEKAFGSKTLVVMPTPDGKVMHAEIKIGDSVIMLGEECAQMNSLSAETRGGSTGALMLYLEDVDASFEKAVKAGCTVKMPVTDMFWGDRYGALVDPFGQSWSLATHIEDVPPEEMGKRAEEAFKQRTQQMAGAAK